MAEPVVAEVEPEPRRPPSPWPSRWPPRPSAGAELAVEAEPAAAEQRADVVPAAHVARADRRTRGAHGAPAAPQTQPDAAPPREPMAHRGPGRRRCRAAVADRPAVGTRPGTTRELPTTLAGRPIVPQDNAAALWAASAREVLTGGPTPATPTAAAPATPQPCVSCGLSLSPNARFCRRCGTRQG